MFCVQVARAACALTQRDVLDDFDVVAFQCGDAARIVGEQADTVQLEIGKDLRADADFALTAALILRQRGQRRSR